MKSQVEGVDIRLERVERELEYLENKIPTESDIEMEEALLEQQIKAAELDHQKKKAKIKVENGRKCVCTVSICMYVCKFQDMNYIIGLWWRLVKQENQENQRRV